MSKTSIKFSQIFNAPVEKVFETITDHESLGRVIKVNIKRIKESQTEYKNGVGSVRRISLFPLPGFDETVIKYEPSKLMEYKISKGSPLKNHNGRLEFFENNGTTKLVYSIAYEARLFF